MKFEDRNKGSNRLDTLNRFDPTAVPLTHKWRGNFKIAAGSRSYALLDRAVGAASSRD